MSTAWDKRTDLKRPALYSHDRYYAGVSGSHPHFALPDLQRALVLHRVSTSANADAPTSASADGGAAGTTTTTAAAAATCAGNMVMVLGNAMDLGMGLLWGAIRVIGNNIFWALVEKVLGGGSGGSGGSGGMGSKY
ncbi:hypothetical protein CHU98_g6690 [Xylaria longipes]|nr:hypothetical protein CHU98_g6690 [Xylaria longipes]